MLWLSYNLKITLLNNLSVSEGVQVVATARCDKGGDYNGIGLRS